MAIQKGQQAPDFSLFNSEKTKVNLADYKGKNLVILFFPQAFTGVCTTELCSVRDNLNVYTSLNADVVGISVDSIFTLAKFKEEQQYNFPLLSDFNKTISQAYEAFYDDFVFEHADRWTGSNFSGRYTLAPCVEPNKTYLAKIINSLRGTQ
jgi:peroxiredoxin